MTAKIISMMNQKGGSGKSTSSQHSAIAMASMGKRVLIMDTDAQRTGIKFFTRNHEAFPEGYDGVIDATYVKAARLQEVIDSYIDSYDYIFVDTAPALGEEMSTIIGLSDFVVISCQPMVKDIEASEDIVDTIRANQQINPDIKAAFAIMRKDPRTNIEKELEEIRSYELPIMDTVIREYKKVYNAADRAGTGVIHMDMDNADKAASDIHHFTEELTSYLAN